MTLTKTSQACTPRNVNIGTKVRISRDFNPTEPFFRALARVHLDLEKTYRVDAISQMGVDGMSLSLEGVMGWWAIEMFVTA